MATRSRRKAREAALRVLYEVEIGGTPVASALNATLEEANLADDLSQFTREVVNGIRGDLAKIDDLLSSLIREYSFDRVSVVDKNVMRIATFELFHMPAIPPAVTINEAIEIAKRYSTEKSGKFVNGILGKVLEMSPKIEWDADKAPIEFEEEEFPEVEAEVEEIELAEDDPELEKLQKIGGWTLRTSTEKLS